MNSLRRVPSLSTHCIAYTGNLKQRLVDHLLPAYERDSVQSTGDVLVQQISEFADFVVWQLMVDKC